MGQNDILSDFFYTLKRKLNLYGLFFLYQQKQERIKGFKCITQIHFKNLNVKLKEIIFMKYEYHLKSFKNDNIFLVKYIKHKV